MATKDSKNTRRFKQLAPALVAGVTIFGVTGATAAFKAVIHDDTGYVACDIDRVEQDADGVTVFLNSNENCYQYLSEADFGASYSLTLGNNNGQAGCALDAMNMNVDGQLIIKAESGCLLTGAMAAPDTECLVDDGKAYVLNVSYDSPSICDPEPDINLRAKSITAGNVTVDADVEFRTAKNGTIRILPPFSVASNHIFRANTDPTS